MTPLGPPGTQLPLEFHRNQSATFETYFAGPNAEAVAALRDVAAGQGRFIAIWGAAGTGKSHLLQALCAARMQAETAPVVYLPMREAAVLGPKVIDGMSTRSLVCIDDIDAVAGRGDWETALFDLYNAIRDCGHSLAFSAGSAPRDLPISLPDLQTRLQWGIVYQLRSLGDDDKRQLILVRARLRGLDIGIDVAEFLLRRLPRDVGGLCEFIDRIDAASLAARRQVTIPFVRTLIEASGER